MITSDADILKLDVTIIDPTIAFATPDRFRGVTLLAEWPTRRCSAWGLIGLWQC
jgi:xanthine dehydrogenase accessory factor